MDTNKPVAERCAMTLPVDGFTQIGTKPVAITEVDAYANSVLARRVVELTELARMVLETNDVPEGPIRQKARELLRKRKP